MLRTDIVQPNQVGFSFDVPTNMTWNLATGNAIEINETFTQDMAGMRVNFTAPLTVNGTLSSGDERNVPNTTEIAATAVWHMLQGFLAAFPEYNPPDNSSVGVNLFAESYGGRYGPIFADMWEDQNSKMETSELSPAALEIHLVSVGIVNGCMDELIEVPLYPDFAVNNTYGFEAYSSVHAQLLRGNFDRPDGCRELLELCSEAVEQHFPDDQGINDEVSTICSTASSVCHDDILRPYESGGRSFYDIGAPLQNSFPPLHYVEYLNAANVHEAIGAVTNFTELSSIVSKEFFETGDSTRVKLIPKYAQLLNRGIRVGLMYGDRDYICNWFGGEAVSLEIARAAGGLYAESFPSAGYAPIVVNESYVGGAVRQFGNLSFSRIYQAGHAAASYQPETAFQIFARIALGTSISTGDVQDLDVFVTEGTPTSEEKDELPDPPSPTCWIRAAHDTCDADQQQMLLNGEGVILNGKLYSTPTDWPLYDSTASTIALTTTSTDLVGVYTATSVPDSAGSRSRAEPNMRLGFGMISSVLCLTFLGFGGV